MKKICCYSAVVLTMLLSVLLTGYITAPRQVAVPQQVQPGPPLGIEDIKAMAKAGVSNEVIVSQIRNTHTVYHLSTADIIALKSAGVDEKVIDYMINTPSTAAPPPASRVRTVVVEPGPAVVAPVIVPFWPCWGWGWHGGHYYDGGPRRDWR